MLEIERPKIVLVNRCLIEENNKLLLVKRSEDDGPRSGLWEFPGGKLDAGQDLPSALKREVHEETGLRIETVSPFPYVDSHIIDSGKYEGMPYVLLVFLGKITGGELQLSEEHTDYAWEDCEGAFGREMTLESGKALRCYLGSTMLPSQSLPLASSGMPLHV